MIAALPVEEHEDGSRSNNALVSAWAKHGVLDFDTNPEFDAVPEDVAWRYSEGLAALSGSGDLLPVIEGLLKEREG